MRLAFSDRAVHAYQRLTPALKRTADKQFSLLLRDLRHSSLRAKKYDAIRSVWQARLTRDWRFYFQIRADVYYILTIIRHPK